MNIYIYNIHYHIYMTGFFLSIQIYFRFVWWFIWANFYIQFLAHFLVELK